MKRRHILAALAATTIAVGSASTITSAGGQPSRQDATAWSFADRYAAFARAPDSRDSLPDGVREMALTGVARHYGPRISEARLFRAAAPRTFVVPTEHGACFIFDEGREGSASGCTADANFLNGDKQPYGVIAAGDGRWRVFAIVPDGTRDVVAAMADGTRVPLPIDGNVATDVLTSVPSTLTWTTPEGNAVSGVVADPRSAPTLP